MSIKQPKPIQIRLPFSVPKPNKNTNTDKRICGICRKKEFKYTCPRCNILYCSLECFRDDSHIQCSEPFYKSTVMTQISSDPKAGIEEKKSMIEMLRRFEESQIEDGESTEDILKQLQELEDEENEYDELIERLKDIDLDSIDSNQLFHLLPKQHRDAFLETLKNPESQEAKELLEEASKDSTGQDGNIPNVLPWWEDQDDVDLDGEDEEVNGLEEPRLQTAPMPELIPDKIIDAISPPEGVGKKLIYNAMAICIAYIHILLSYRIPSLSPEYLRASDISSQEIKDNINELLPFLVNPKSTTRYENISSAWGSVWDKIIGQDQSTHLNISVLQHLLSKLPTLVHPSLIQPSYPKLFYLISDLYTLYDDKSKKSRFNELITKKLSFYFKALRSLDRSDWLKLETEIEKELDGLQGEDSSEHDAELTRRQQLEII
ncbi:uncharacterized protein L201_006000 [Kwoniella dendrophila CBS 6074]|uniref:HIT-type domain-containing protein n=1 Tax=Kwoniella dendrophila CBS 6074 TaxID=1295534 RepID=A0AAX4K1S0_9TREE